MSQPDLIKPTEDAWEAWKADPTTQWVLSGVQRFSELQREAFAAMFSTPTGTPIDQAQVDRLKVRADAYAGLAGLKFEDAIALHGEDA